MKGVIKGHEPNQTYWLDGKQVSKAEFDLAFPDQNLGGNASLCPWKPLHSEALAVHPDLIGDATADAAKKGVPTEFDVEGRPVFTSRSHRAEYMRRYGFYDRSGGYGDAQRGQSDAQSRDCGQAPEYDVDVPRNEIDYRSFSDEQKRKLDRDIDAAMRRR